MVHGTVLENIFFFFSFVCVCACAASCTCACRIVWVGAHTHMSTLACGGLKTASAFVPQELPSCLLTQTLP